MSKNVDEHLGLIQIFTKSVSSRESYTSVINGVEASTTTMVQQTSRWYIFYYLLVEFETPR